ncbi:PepSY-associated TM helix domain-containing protein [Halarcobacter sp.]|uniref:PepSY-associated TM helix domain-containing protein n=1 Tax=Halarcobacter sp. TaxID=2321133 RepID=UPI003AFFF7AB
MKIDKLNNKYLTRAHTVLGLIAIFLFYISTYFGTITIFKPYIQAWELPSTHFSSDAKFEQIIDLKLYQIVRENKLNVKNIEIELPSFKDERLKISSQNQNSVYLNPYTKEILNLNNEYPTISTLFNKLHTGANIPYIGLTLMGVASSIMLFLMISGLILYLVKSEKTNENHNKNFRFKWHKNFGIILTPYVIIFALTGAFLGLMLSTSSVYALSNTNFEKQSIRALVGPIIFKQKALLEDKNKRVKPLQLSKLEEIAQKNYPELKIRKINIYNYRLENSQTVFSGYLKNNRALSSSRINPLSITLDSKTGEVLEKKELEDTHMIKKTLSTFYWLHFQTDEPLLIRIIFFILGIVMLICLLFGYLLWAEKKLSSDYGYYEILNRFSIALLLGIIPASAILMILHWLIPFSMFDRIIWIEGLFYVSWSFYLFYSFKETSIKKIFKMIFLSSSILFMLTFLLHEMHTDILLFELFSSNLTKQFAIDLLLIIIACLFYFLYKRVDSFSYLEKFERRSNV